MTEKSMKIMDVTGYPLPTNMLGSILKHTMQERMDVVDRISFWKKWGGEVRKTINEMKTTTSRQVKNDFIGCKLIHCKTSLYIYIAT